MDSMRTLDSSLPRTRKLRPGSRHDVHQAFRTAALTVTTLYKTALADLDNARSEGYRDALEDVVAFLDKEGVGLADGEGWRIRQWVADLLEKTSPGQAASDSDEDTLEEKRARSSSPVMERISSLEETRAAEPAAESTHRSDSAPPPVHMEASTSESNFTPPQTVFQFTSPQAYPTADATFNDTSGSGSSAAARRALASSRRTSSRPSSKNMQRTAAQNLLSLGNGAGQKRKLMQEFFNIDPFNDRRDSSGGGPKRGRMS